ncbi:cell division protein ZipA C-terminal FtsZ-binding domain-containing protein [Guyparkeria sp. 1SP6A2]|nr:cell division protein ZipA C-terminal FtsZ-binding domain-containing protein [Guyparkeria sp. 1SP6A2]
MEWLRWIVLFVGLVVIGGMVWMYRRHRSEQAVDLSGGKGDRDDYHDPIDASVGARTHAEAEDAAPARQEPRLDVENAWSTPDADGFVDGASAGRVVSRAPEAPKDVAPAAEPPQGTGRPASPSPQTPPAERPDTEPAPRPDSDPEPAARPQAGFSSLFTRRGQGEMPADRAEPAFEEQPEPDEPAEAEESAEQEPAGGAVISMMIVDREQVPMSPERVRRAIEESGFEHGAFSIYHFHDLNGDDWFSLMNAVSPGQFDPDDLASYETPALALFMQLPVRGADPSLVFDRMHQVATTLAESLDAMLIDDRREPLDTESIDRYRDLIDRFG